MPAYNFKPEFAPLVEAGAKKQTVRKPRQRPTLPGDHLVLYVGQRTPACRLLRRAICCSVQPVMLWQAESGDMYLEIDGIRQWDDAADAFASADGFDSFAGLASFFTTTYGLPFEGEVVRWY